MVSSRKVNYSGLENLVDSNYSFIKFIKFEFNDRLIHKGLGRFLMNMFSFPFISVLNYILFRKWLKVYDKVGSFMTESYDSIEIKANELEKLNIGKIYKNFGKERFVIRANRAHFVETDDSYFLFPFDYPESKDNFCTMIDSPFRLKKNGKENYHFIHGLLMCEIKSIEWNGNKTQIMFSAPEYNEQVELTVNKNLLKS